MSVNMLGVQHGEQEKDRKENDNAIKSKKTSPSIKSFFQSKESEKTDNEPASQKDIKNFFLPQSKSICQEKTVDSEVELIQDSDKDDVSILTTNDASPIDVSKKDIKNFFLPQSKVISHERTVTSEVEVIQNSKKDDVDVLKDNDTSPVVVVEECQAGEKKAHRTVTMDQDKCDSLSKKVRPKWSLSWKVTKKSKKSKDSGSDSDCEDFLEVSNVEKEIKVGFKKVKRRQSKTEKDGVDSCSEGKSETMEKKNNEDQQKKERRHQKTAMKEIIKDAVEKNRNDQVKGKKNRLVEHDESLFKTKETVQEKGELVDTPVISEKDDCKISKQISSKPQNKQIKSAFDVLMSPTKEVDKDDLEVALVSIEDGEDSSFSLHQKESVIESPKECSPKSLSGSGNAFDVLMAKKETSECNNLKKSPQKSKIKASKFKLNIRYSKPLEFENESDAGNDNDDKGVVDDDDDSDKSEVPCKKGLPKTFGWDKSKKTKKHSPNERTSTKKSKDTSHGKAERKTQSKPVSVGTTENQTDVKITYVSEETLKVVEEPRKMAKVKKKKNKTKMSKSSSSVQIEIQEDSNSSVQEIPSNSVADKTPKTSSCTNSVIISPGSDDFEVTPTRAGLRKRTNPKNYATLREPAKFPVKDKKNQDKKKEEYPGMDPETPEIELVKTYKTTKQNKEDEKPTAPQSLASIFIKKPKTIAKKDETSAQISATQTTQPKNENTDIKPMDEAELKAANNAFKALFATCKSIKTPTSAVQTCQQPAPWPTISHVTQKDDDQSELGDSKMKVLPWKPELIQDCSHLKKRVILLGEFTSSLYRNDSLEKKSKQLKDRSPSDCLSPVVVKKLLSELASYFPGIPIKRLYKQYKNKEDEGKKDNENTAKECTSSKGRKEDQSKGKDSSSKVQELQKSKGRTKRKISIQSDDETSEKQHKKVPKTKEKKEKVNREKCKEADFKNESARRPRSKRGRDDEEEEVQNEQNTKRKSTRLQERRENKKEPQQDERTVESSKRKKRKTMEDETSSKQVTEEMEKSEDSRASLDEKKNPEKRDLLWTEKYQPESSSEIMGNASAVSRLRSWLEAWKVKREKTLRKEIEMEKRRLAKQKNKDSSERKLAWWEEDQDSDFHLSDEESDDSDSEGAGLCNTMLVLGPKGAGKTAAVYACAKELGYKVFEVNCSSKRSSKQILSRLEEATQSHLVITNPSANTPKSSAFGGLFGNLSEKPGNSSSMSNFFKKSNESQENKHAKSERNKKGAQEKNAKERKMNGREKEEKGNNSAMVVASGEENNSNPTLSLKAASLIFFEEVDVIFDDDKGFWSAVTSFMNNAKCPIIMTSNDSRVDCDGRYEHLMIRSPSINLLSAHLLVTGLVNNVLINPAELKILASWYKCDIRKCLLALQFWINSGAGVTKTWDEFSKNHKDVKLQSEVHVGFEAKTNPDGASQGPLNAAKLNPDTVEQPSGLDDQGEESLFLSLDDWKTLAKRPTRAARRGHQTLDSTSDFQNDDSDFEPTKPSSHAPIDVNTHTDSILDSHEPSDSQSIQISDNEVNKVSMPDVHCLLVEHVLGMTNCAPDCDSGSLELLKQVDMTREREKNSLFKTRCSLTYHSQTMGLNLVNNNLPTLLPSLHTDRLSSDDSRPVAKVTKESADHDISQERGKDGGVFSMFSDQSLFDDGTSTPSKRDKVKNVEAMEGSSDRNITGLDKTKSTNKDSDGHSNPDVVAMVTDEKCDVGETTARLTNKKQKDPKLQNLQGKTLEIFSTLAEDISYMDAYIPNMATDACSDRTAAYGWWHAHVRAGLSDKIVTAGKRPDWSTSDTNACVRGALEVASLESSHARHKSLLETGKKNWPDKDRLLEDLDNYLPVRDVNALFNLTGLNDTQKSKLSNRNKLYKTVSSSLPGVTHCTHGVVSLDYLPALRSICYTEKLREQANTKRRFLHYLDSSSLSLSKSSQQSLADAFLAQ